MISPTCNVGSNGCVQPSHVLLNGMHMLPLTTARAGGISVFSAIWEPYQTPKTTVTIRMTTIAVWKASFFQTFLLDDVKMHIPFD